MSTASWEILLASKPLPCALSWVSTAINRAKFDSASQSALSQPLNHPPDADLGTGPRSHSAGFPPLKCEDASRNDRDRRCAHDASAMALPHFQVS